ncbi:CHRD domain-containing protein [Thalassomonas viridans]|uniref:CHRD domain-containing protein n=1 Tax=Thalassomonas viridans TaxID=137584 RepID=A0AAF0C8E5_9GAMM|nr:CHRD domain-containing protein [Thalassomonas viridans]WDE03794.1 CHRD domain-containing protein [Thalassomonas viridans]
MIKALKAGNWPAIICFMLCLLPGLANASIITYQMELDGLQEIPVGDLDGTASGTISFDDVTGLISWDLTYTDIDTPTAMHIHGPGGTVGINAGVFIGLGVNTSGGPNTLIDSLVANLADVNTILNDPGGFYINIHTAEFPPGSVRGQLGNVLVPAPGTLPLLIIAALLLLQSTRKTRQGQTK